MKNTPKLQESLDAAVNRMTFTIDSIIEINALKAEVIRLHQVNRKLTHAAQQMLTVLESFVKWADPDCGDPTCDDCNALRPTWAAIEAGKAALGTTKEEQK
jgi:hypothetical protein